MASSAPHATELPVSASTGSSAPLASSALFWKPRHGDISRNLARIPFLFWLVETLRPSRVVQIGLQDPGVYLALCQAVDKLGLEALCMGVDPTTEGLQVGKKVSQQNHLFYSDFSVLLHEDVASVSRHLTGQPIDLLLIDADLTGDQIGVLRDLWLPRLSEQGVLILLNSAAKPGSPSVPNYLEQMLGTSPHGAFPSDRMVTNLYIGLVGTKPPAALHAMTDHRMGITGYLASHPLFERVGQALEAERKLRKLEAAEKERNQELANAVRDLTSARATIEKAETSEANHAAEIKTLRSSVQTLESDSIAIEARVEALDQQRSAAERAVEALAGQLAQAEKSDAERLEALQAAEAQAREYRSKIRKLQEAQAALETRRFDLETMIATRDETLSTLKKKYAVAEQAATDATRLILQNEQDAQAASRKSKEIRASAALAQQQVADLTEENLQLNQMLADRDDAFARQARQNDEEIARLREHVTSLLEQQDEMNSRLIEGDKALTDLTIALTNVETAAATEAHNAREFARQAKTAQRLAHERKDAGVRLEEELAKLASQNADLEARSCELERLLDAQKGVTQEADDKRVAEVDARQLLAADLDAAYHQLQLDAAELVHIRWELSELEAEKKTLDAQHVTREEELSRLATDLAAAEKINADEAEITRQLRLQLEQRSIAAEALQEEQGRMQKAMTALLAEKDDLDAQLTDRDKALAEMAQQVSTLKKHGAAQTEAVQNSSHEIATLTHMVEQFREVATRAQNSAALAKARVAELDVELIERENGLVALAEQLAISKKVAAIQAEAADVHADEIEAITRIAELFREEADRLKRTGDLLATQNQQLNLQLVEREHALVELAEALAASNKADNALAGILRTSTEEVETLTRIAEAFREENMRLQRQA